MSGSPRVIIKIKAGSAGGSMTLIGREGEAGEWQFARITIDQTEALFGKADVPLPEVPVIGSLEWLDGWEAGLAGVASKVVGLVRPDPRDETRSQGAT